MSALTSLLTHARHVGATDLWLATGRPTLLRRHGVTLPMTPATDHDAALAALLEDATGDRLGDTDQVTFATDTPAGRVRAHVVRHTDGLAATVHLLPAEPPALDALALPSLVSALVTQASGLVLVAGPRGSGRTCTAAALLQQRTHARRGHALTLESPIEFVFAPESGPITARELGAHTPSLRDALQDVTRLDVDTLLVPEASDADALTRLLAIAESGALVILTVTAPDTVSALTRVLRAWPRHAQERVRARLASQLRVALALRLVTGLDGVTVHPACEVLVNHADASTALREGAFPTLATLLARADRSGSRTLDQALSALVARGLVSRDAALVHAQNPGAFVALAPPEAA